MAATAARPKDQDVKAYIFTWEGKDKSGKIVKGEMRASGENIVTATLRRLTDAERVDALLESLGLGRVESVVCDVTSTAQVDALISSTTGLARSMSTLETMTLTSPQTGRSPTPPVRYSPLT